MDAMSYEFLIRRAYKCGRFGVKGANADIFRTLETDSYRYNTALKEIKENLPRSWGENLDDLAFKYKINSRKVAYHIIDAIKKVQGDLSSSLTEEETEELENCINELHDPTIEKIDQVIQKAEKIMISHGLFPG